MLGNIKFLVVDCKKQDEPQYDDDSPKVVFANPYFMWHTFRTDGSWPSRYALNPYNYACIATCQCLLTVLDHVGLASEPTRFLRKVVEVKHVLLSLLYVRFCALCILRLLYSMNNHGYVINLQPAIQKVMNIIVVYYYQHQQND